MQGDNAAARPFVENGLALAREAGSSAVVAFVLHGLGQFFLSQGNHPAARQVLGESLTLARRLDDPWATARVLSSLGSLAR